MVLPLTFNTLRLQEVRLHDVSKLKYQQVGTTCGKQHLVSVGSPGCETRQYVFRLARAILSTVFIEIKQLDLVLKFAATILLYL